MEELINKLKEFKAADDSAKEMEETIKEAMEYIVEQEDEINVLTAQRDSIVNQFEQAKEVIEKQQEQLQEKDKEKESEESVMEEKS